MIFLLHALDLLPETVVSVEDQTSQAATEEIDMIILGSELVALREPLAVLQTTLVLPMFQLWVLPLSEQIHSSVEQQSPALMSK